MDGCQRVRVVNKRPLLVRHWGLARAIAVLLAATMTMPALWYARRPESWFRLALSALDSHNWEQLRYRQLAFAGAAEQTAMESLLAGALGLERREFHGALRELRYAVRHPRTRSRALTLCAEALYALNDFRGAEAYLTQALRADPNLVEMHRWLAIVYYDMGLMPRVLYHLERVAELDPRDPRPHRVMGVVHMDRNGPAIAVEDYEESLRRDPNQPDGEEIRLDLAEAQVALNRFEEAVATLRACPSSAPSLALQAECAYSMGNAARATELVAASLELDPGQRLALRVRAKLAIDERQYDKAVEVLLPAVADQPADRDLRYLLLTALRAVGRNEEAEQQNRALKEIEQLRQKYDDLLEEAVKEPYDAERRYALGLLAERLDMPELAYAWFRAAVGLNAEHGLATAELQRYPQTENAAAVLRGS